MVETYIFFPCPYFKDNPEPSFSVMNSLWNGFSPCPTQVSWDQVAKHRLWLLSSCERVDWEKRLDSTLVCGVCTLVCYICTIFLFAWWTKDSYRKAHEIVNHVRKDWVACDCFQKIKTGFIVLGVLWVYWINYRLQYPLGVTHRWEMKSMGNTCIPWSRNLNSKGIKWKGQLHPSFKLGLPGVTRITSSVTGLGKWATWATTTVWLGVYQMLKLISFPTWLNIFLLGTPTKNMVVNTCLVC